LVNKVEDYKSHTCVTNLCQTENVTIVTREHRETLTLWHF